MSTNPTPEHKEQARAIINQHSSVAFLSYLGQAPFNELIELVSAALSSRDAEVREVLEGLSMLIHYTHGQPERCWCNNHNSNWTHTQECLAARALYAKLSGGSS